MATGVVVIGSMLAVAYILAHGRCERAIGICGAVIVLLDGASDGVVILEEARLGLTSRRRGRRDRTKDIGGIDSLVNV